LERGPESSTLNYFTLRQDFKVSTGISWGHKDLPWEKKVLITEKRKEGAQERRILTGQFLSSFHQVSFSVLDVKMNAGEQSLIL
jgi:hypothetical protein